MKLKIRITTFFNLQSLICNKCIMEHLHVFCLTKSQQKYVYDPLIMGLLPCFLYVLCIQFWLIFTSRQMQKSSLCDAPSNKIHSVNTRYPACVLMAPTWSGVLWPSSTGSIQGHVAHPMTNDFRRKSPTCAQFPGNITKDFECIQHLAQWIFAVHSFD